MLTTPPPRLSLPALRNLILGALVIATLAYTATMFFLAQRLSERFGPQVRADLEWRVQRGAQELSLACDVGLVLRDAQILRKAFGVYAESSDVEAIVAVDESDKVIATHGTPPEALSALFGGQEQVVRSEPGYLVSWARSNIEGATVGRVALVVSTRRLLDANALLVRASNVTLLGGLAALVLGVLVVSFYTRAVRRRDEQLSDYASNLELKVEERTRELDERNSGMRLVLDNVAQGFITVDLAGIMSRERSAIIDRWLDPPEPGVSFVQHIERHAPEFAFRFECNLAQVAEGILPSEVGLGQLPHRFSAQGKTFDVAYRPVSKGAQIEQLLIIISDVTEQLAHERVEREQKELLTIFQRILIDRSSVEEFLAESVKLVRGLSQDADPLVQRRLVHTLKGNAAMYGLGSIAELAHAIENELTDSDAPLSSEQRRRLETAWQEAMGRVENLLGNSHKDRIELERGELLSLIERTRGGAPASELVRELASWQREPVARQLEQLGNQAVGLARRLHKPEPEIRIQAGGVRLDGSVWASYWAAMVHAVRNAVDHGLEDAPTRIARGKPPGSLALGATRAGARLTIWLEDDGRGIDWERVRERAAQRGMASERREDLIEALFADGFSTRDAASDVSGRGVGLAALRQAVRDLSGIIRIDSTLGQGTKFSFSFEEPDSMAEASAEAHPPSRVNGTRSAG